MRDLRCLAAGLTLAFGLACARPVRMVTSPHVSLPCRAPTGDADARLTWTRPDDPDERRDLDDRCAQVGPPLVLRGALPGGRPVTHLAIVTWNLHDGRGDIARLLADLDAGRHGAQRPDAVILLLQEFVRTTATGAAPAALARAGAPDWHLVYVPARRTTLRGAPPAPADRGTAILSSIPLTDLAAIELPVERQRRIAVAASVNGVTASGRPWRARIINAHLENRPGMGRLWVRAAAARTRQAEALLDAIDLPPAGRDAGHSFVLGGDLNTWLGRYERAWQLLRDAFPAWQQEDVRPTLAFGQRVDHLFARFPEGTLAVHRRMDGTYGSDHHPVVAAIDFGAHQQDHAAHSGRLDAR